MGRVPLPNPPFDRQEVTGRDLIFYVSDESEIILYFNLHIHDSIEKLLVLIQACLVLE